MCPSWHFEINEQERVQVKHKQLKVNAGRNIVLFCTCSDMGILNIAGSSGVKDGIGVAYFFIGTKMAQQQRNTIFSKYIVVRL